MGRKDSEPPAPTQPLNLFKKMQLIKSENDLIELSSRPVSSHEQSLPSSNGSALHSAHSSNVSFQNMSREHTLSRAVSSSSSIAPSALPHEADTLVYTNSDTAHSSSGANVLKTFRQVR